MRQFVYCLGIYSQKKTWIPASFSGFSCVLTLLMAIYILEVKDKKSYMAEVFEKSSKNLLGLWLISLKGLSKRLSRLETYEEKIAVLQSLGEVKDFLSSHEMSFVKTLNPLDGYLILSLIAIRQEHVLTICQDPSSIENLLCHLRGLEEFFFQVGGVIGYQIIALDLLKTYVRQDKPVIPQETFHPPQGLDLTQKNSELDAIIVQGILAQDKMAEIYPVGGAADRLKLQDDKTHFDLPAACLEFLGKSLLEGMIRDLQAREYLYYKLTKKQTTTPVALMTSEEKSNDKHIKNLFWDNAFFGRPQTSITFFSQPLVPTFTEDGLWCLKDQTTLLCKPGGHGVIWKMAKEKGVLSRIKKHQKTKILVRQINNPIAGVDLGLIALIGLGFKTKKCFGFASCLRRVQTQEGINILKEKKSSKGFRIVLSNIEYCDFKKFNIIDQPKKKGSLYSVFPSNTNILFADISSTEKAIETLPYPGMLVNFKEMACLKHNVNEKRPIARVELLMQNIADGFEKICVKSLNEDPHPNLHAFITFNKRHKTISSTKKQFVPGTGLVETAVGCFYDYLKNIWDLFTQYCGFELPLLVKEEIFLAKGPPFIVIYHPSLGPLYSIIQQKIQKGRLSQGSEMQLEITELEIKDLDLKGSLIIQADQVLGHKEEGVMRYSDNVGHCILRGVQIKNQGIDHTQENVFWKNKIYRKEALKIHLKGKSLFFAEDVIFEGPFDIVVEDGESVTAIMDQGKITLRKRPLKDCPVWNYHLSQESQIILSRSKKLQCTDNGASFKDHLF